MYFFIPNTIFETTKTVKSKMNHAITSLCKRLGTDGDQEGSTSAKYFFSATDFLFVSTRLAKAFPDLLESSVILAYCSEVIAEAQRNKWMSTTASLGRQSVPRYSSWTWLLAAMGPVLTTCVLILGSQSISVQETVVYAINPVLLGGMSLLGSFVSNKPYIAFPVGAMLLVAAGFTMYYLKSSNLRSLVERTVDLWKSRRNSNMRIAQVVPLTSETHAQIAGTLEPVCPDEAHESYRQKAGDVNESSQLNLIGEGIGERDDSRLGSIVSRGEEEGHGVVVRSAEQFSGAVDSNAGEQAAAGPRYIAEGSNLSHGEGSKVLDAQPPIQERGVDSEISYPSLSDFSAESSSGTSDYIDVVTDKDSVPFISAAELLGEDWSDVGSDFNSADLMLDVFRGDSASSQGSTRHVKEAVLTNAAAGDDDGAQPPPHVKMETHEGISSEPSIRCVNVAEVLGEDWINEECDEDNND